MRHSTPGEEDSVQPGEIRPGLRARLREWREELSADLRGELGSRGVRVSLCAFLLAAVALRVVALGRMPGLNGDEAYFGIQALKIVAGKLDRCTTVSGNLMNPFHTGPLAVLHIFFEPAFWVLRAPALVANLLLIPLVLLMVRRASTVSTALAAAILTAALPVNIANSRFGWDPSHSVLFTFVALGFAMQNRRAAFAVAMAAAFLVHPTNVFLLPAAVAPLLVDAVRKRRQAGKPVWLAAACSGVVLAGLGCVLLVTYTKGLSRVCSTAIENLRDPGAWLGLPMLYTRFLSGTLTFRYICGSATGVAAAVIDWLFLIGLVILCVVGLRRLHRRGEYAFLACFVGLVLSLIAFCVVAGIRNICTPSVRYVLFLAAPSCLLIARMLCVCLGPERAVRFALLLGWFLLGSFAVNYFVAVRFFGSRSHPAFYTGPEEPKVAAYRRVCSDLAPGQRAVVLAHTWWLSQPLRYLSAMDGAVTVARVEAASCDLDALRSQPGCGAYLVVFTGDVMDKAVSDRYGHLVRKGWQVTDYQGRSIVRVYRLYH